MRFIVVADIHGDFEKLSAIMERVRGYDAIICPGDFTDMYVTAGFSQDDTAQLILEELLAHKKPVFCVPGNHDTKNMLKMFEDAGVSIHGKGKLLGHVGLFGFGGAKTPFNTVFEPDDDEVLAGLKNGWDDVKNASVKIMVVHNPPRETAMDKVASGSHVGSAAVTGFIKTHQPDVVVSAHIHESRGVDRLNSTVLIYPGTASDGWVGTIDVGHEIKVDIQNALR